MIANRCEIINFRLKPKEKNLLKLLANKMDLRLSELLRNIIYKKLKDENLIN